MGNCQNKENQELSLEPQGPTVEGEVQNIKKNKPAVQVKSQIVEQEQVSDDPQHKPNKKEATQLEVIPDYTTIAVKYQCEKLGAYTYSYQQYDVPKAVRLGPFQILKDDSVYIGQWFNGVRQGRGKIIFKDGSVYEGYWKDGQRHGRGRQISSSGNIYEGEWVNDQSVGIRENEVGSQHKPVNTEAIPIDIIPDYCPIQVKWQKEKLNDFVFDQPKFECFNAFKIGPYQFTSDKSVYVGQWLNGKRCGRGKQYYRDGSIYEGYWRDGLRHGKGRIIYINGTVYEGEWNNDKTGPASVLAK